MTKRLLFRGAKQLVTLRGPSALRRGNAMQELGIIQDGAVLVENGRIQNVGATRRVENLAEARDAEEIDVYGKVLMPGFVDSHTHLVHGPPRLNDYEMRLAGKSYEEVAEAGGGIQQSMRAVRTWSSKRLEGQAWQALLTAARHGTTTVEVKSGYGLEELAEVKMLRAAQHWDGDPIHILTTLLGPHAVPPEFEGRPDDYISYLIAEVLPTVSRRKLARFADVYCDRNAFTVEQARRWLLAAREAGLTAKIHANQWSNLGAVQMAVEMGAISVDHLENLGREEIELLGQAPVACTLLPGSVFHLGLRQYAPARELIAAGAGVALATDYNPGSSPTCSMPMILSIACAQMRMSPAEAITAATINGAAALGIAEQTGSLEFGKRADLLVLDLPDYRELPYYFGVNHVAMTVSSGKIVRPEQSQPDLEEHQFIDPW